MAKRLLTLEVNGRTNDHAVADSSLLSTCCATPWA